MPLPKFSNDDGLTPVDRLRGHLSESERWLRFSGPLGRVLVAVVAVVGLGSAGVLLAGALNGGSEDTTPRVRVASLATVPLPSPTPTPGPPPAQVIEQPVNVEVWRASTFAWPASGRISAFFGLGDRTGITIETEPASDVLASARGTVKSVGAAAADRYSIVVEHDGGLKSLYSNVAGPSVEVNQRVERRQAIGKTGPGRAGRGQVHFELLAGTEAQDPLRYLPTTALDPTLSRPESASCPTSSLIADPASSLNLIFSSDALRSFTIKEASVKTLIGGNQQDIEARPKGQLSLTLDVRPRAVEASRSLEYVLETIFGNGSELRSAICRLTVNTATLIPGASLGELTIAPTPKPATATPTPGVATVTPTRTKTPTRTPTGSRTPGTKTPTSKAGTKTPTSKPGTKTATPKKGTPTPSKSSTPPSSQ